MGRHEDCGPGSGGMAPGQPDVDDGEGGGSAPVDGPGEANGDEHPGEDFGEDSGEDSGGGGADPDHPLGGGDSGVEDLHELRLTALLHQLVRRLGHKGAARDLGVNPRTVAASVKQGMSRRVREALERMLVDRDGEARDRLEDEVRGLAEQAGG